ncbi:MAG: ABC transporter ATP-binding protein [Anaerolineales bacterium]|nr:ABC transporter ATP-binding protein [Anaerolineales bacterium]
MIETGESPVIRFEGVSKRFTFTREKSQSILEILLSAFRRKSAAAQDRDLWALRDVSFDILPGQCVGIVGRNGSGKSTALKLAARILRPTNGRVWIRGRVGALLELGAGFHPDLTGRENIYLNASLLGLSQADIDECFAQIVEFSELGDFIEMPVKHYSSGMYMRLGFSVAIHIKPDILIVDEILAVGDQAFQAKCIDRIYDMRDKGTTIVMVSHNLNILRSLCSHLLWIDHGALRMWGPTEEVAAQYMAYAYEQEARQAESTAESEAFKRWGSGEVEITAVRFLNSEGKETNTFTTDEAMTIELAYTAHQPIKSPEFGFDILRQDGAHVSRPNSVLSGLNVGTVMGSGKVCYHIDRLPLLPAKYRVTAAIYNGRHQSAYDHHDQAYTFRIVPSESTHELYGLVQLPATWEFQPEAPVPM